MSLKDIFIQSNTKYKNNLISGFDFMGSLRSLGALNSLLTESLSQEWNRVGAGGFHRLLATPWTAACQAPPSMGFSRQEYWSGVPHRKHLNLTQKIIELLFLKVCYYCHCFCFCFYLVWLSNYRITEGKFITVQDPGQWDDHQLSEWGTQESTG